jgi:uncharacterized SAM-binding protein YcdF (DUF218 family)
MFVGVCFYVVFMFSPVGNVMLSSLERPYRPLVGLEGLQDVQTIAVLGGYGEASSALSVTGSLLPETMSRLVEGIRLWRLRPDTKLLVAGGATSPGAVPLAKLMADAAVALGVPVSALVMEGTSRTTFENLVGIKRYIGSGRFILVGSACDLPRALAVASKLGLHPVAAPVPIWGKPSYPSGTNWADFVRAFVADCARPSVDRFVFIERAYHEVAGYYWYRLRGRA